MSRKSVRKALREGEVEKDTYERLTCVRCGVALQTENDPDEVHTVKHCPECGRSWNQLG